MYYSKESINDLGFCSEDEDLMLSFNIKDSSLDIKNNIINNLNELGFNYSNTIDKFIRQIQWVILRELFIIQDVKENEDVLNKYLDIKVLTTKEFVEDIDYIYEYKRDNDIEDLKYNSIRVIANQEESISLDYDFSHFPFDLATLRETYDFNVSVSKTHISNDFENDKYYKLYSLNNLKASNIKPSVILYEESNLSLTDRIIKNANVKFKLYIIY